MNTINSAAISPATQLAIKSRPIDVTPVAAITELIAAKPISEVWIALGGPPPKRGRARAFFRDGDNPFAVSLNDANGVWFDHRNGVGGGVLDLIQQVRGCDRGGALRWLADLNGTSLASTPLTPAQHREYARQRAEMSEMSAWKMRLVDALKLERKRWWEIYHGALAYIRDHSLESPLGDIAATLNELAEDHIAVLDRKVETLEAAPFSGLLPIFWAQKGKVVV